MKGLYITKAELNQIEYMDNAIKNLKTPKQKLAIEYKEENKIIKLREKRLKEVKKQPKRIMLNHKPWTFINEEDLTDEQIEKEVEYANRDYY